MPLVGRLRWNARAAMIGLTASGLLIAPAAVSAAAATMNATGLSVTVDDRSVAAAVTVSSSATVKTDQVGVCVRDAAGADKDFASFRGVTVTSTPRVLQRTATFEPGTYRYFACVQTDGEWAVLGAVKTFTVDADDTQPTSTPRTSSGMPVGNLPGWRQVFTEDFTTPLRRGAFPGPYAAQWLSYDGFTDTSKAGDYDQSIISAQDGALDLYLHAENGRPLGAAPVPLVNGQWGGQTYGRFSVRMKAEAAAGYGAGFVLWNDSGNWADGEIDFPESGLDDVVKGYNHCPGNPSKNCYVANTKLAYTGWHVYTIDWSPSKLSFLVDDVEVGATTTNIPNQPLHWVMQVATTGDAAAAARSSGHLLIDWATIYALD